MNIILGIIGMIIGASITIYSEKLLNAFGSIAFFDKYLGTEGGSRLGYKLIGLLVFFLAMLTATGLIQGFLMWVLSPIISTIQR